MKRLFIADVHANLPAFEAVLRDAGTVDETIFLGDILDFGPHPAACVDRLQRLNARAILGNHDLAILAREGNPVMPSDFLDWGEWTYGRLTPAQLRYLRSLPRELNIESCGLQTTVIHQLPSAPYLYPTMSDDILAHFLGDVPGRAVYCGHCHYLIDRALNGRRLVCFPPVGQSRNGDPRAGYAIEEDGRLQFRFVRYDIETVVADIKKIGLPELFCERWIRFLRTGFDQEWSRIPASKGVIE
ncbi:MAG: metallophosphatase family protein [Verrucomicrobia bacterium]|nr:metallophosphatase family protein [Verrucomicrobiota bacterium]MCG2681468.1 metallophosphatase family protein [Kiritimatiellia bacterium]MBU4247212.1 metallophosphatase family protein [Verrucomicrobiota bacterium]MBU4289707.1 metallophosphatase family protein [Verrucomicrobiota bacterium]MBU4428415.1 metallophosphatase family protein [Verrucomicrobiota bacterium]